MEQGVLIAVTGTVAAMVLLVLAVWWSIFSKAGYSGWYAILMFVPIANLVGIFLLAFGDWPVLRELRKLRTLCHTPVRHHFELTH